MPIQIKGTILQQRLHDIIQAELRFKSSAQELAAFNAVNSQIRIGPVDFQATDAGNRKNGAAAAEGNHRAQLAIDMQSYQILKFVGSYIAAMNGVDAIVFTGGIGENDADIRAFVCENLKYIGVELDKEANKQRGEEIKISTENSKVNVYVIPTNEELAIARDTLAIISK